MDREKTARSVWSAYKEECNRMRVIMCAHTHVRTHHSCDAVIPPTYKWWGLWRSAVWRFLLILICVPWLILLGYRSSGIRRIICSVSEEASQRETHTEKDPSQADLHCSPCPLKMLWSTTVIQKPRALIGVNRFKCMSVIYLQKCQSHAFDLNSSKFANCFSVGKIQTISRHVFTPS